MTLGVLMFVLLPIILFFALLVALSGLAQVIRERDALRAELTELKARIEFDKKISEMERRFNAQV